MTRYERVTTDNSQTEISTAEPVSDTQATPPVPRPHVGGGGDGVFANMAAKPETPGKLYQDIEPPSYNDVMQEQAPPYFEATVVSTYDEDGEILIEGYPVGSPVIFMVNAIVSMCFDFIGFLLTTLLATSHAARCGSRMGLGITFLRYAFYIKGRDAEDELNQYKFYNPETTETPERLKVENQWMSYLLMVIGFFLILHANAEYYRASKLRSLALSNPETTAA